VNNLSSENISNPIKDDLLAWVSLNNFLPQKNIRDLCIAIIDIIGGGKYKIDSFFNENFVGGDGFWGSWVISQKEGKYSDLEDYLISYVKSFVWRSEHLILTHRDKNLSLGEISSSALDNAIGFRLRDVNSNLDKYKADAIETNQKSYECLISSLILTQDQLRSDADFNEEAIVDASRTSGAIISPAIIKYCGDMCALVDRHKQALQLYKAAKLAIPTSMGEFWSLYRKSLLSSVNQSIASSTRYVYGADHASIYFDEAYGEFTDTENNLLFSLNSSIDNFSAKVTAKENQLYTNDLRAIRMRPPMLLDSFRHESGLDLAIEKKFSQSNEILQRILRRQIGLGSYVAASETRTALGINIMAELVDEKDRASLSDFTLGIRLLMHGDAEAIKRVKWADIGLQRYVTQDLINEISEYPKRLEGVFLERKIVVCTLFGEWSRFLDGKSKEEIKAMISYLANDAAAEESSIYSNRNVAGLSFQAIKTFGERRPELRSMVSGHVADAICHRLERESFWVIYQTAIEVAHIFSSSFSLGDLRRIFDSVISYLSEKGIKGNNSFIIRAALNFLSSDAVRIISTSEKSNEEKIAHEVMRFGSASEFEGASAMFQLQNLAPSLLARKDVQEEMRPILDNVMKSAKKINSSNVVYNIMALLVVPGLSGEIGIKVAFEAIHDILNSVGEKRQSIAFLNAYRPILFASKRLANNAKDIGVSEDEINRLLKGLVDPMIRMWSIAAASPGVFSESFIRDTEHPDETALHNWAYTSFILSEELRDRRLSEVVVGLRGNPVFFAAITLAQSTLLSGESSVFSDLHELSLDREGVDEFYESLGRRLARLTKSDGATSKALCIALQNRCLQLGPREIDASVFLLAKSMGILGEASVSDIENYKIRLDGTPDLIPSLVPIVNAIWDK
jgi:hypothetical protein